MKTLIALIFCIALAPSAWAKSSNGSSMEVGGSASGALYQVLPLAPRLQYVYDYVDEALTNDTGWLTAYNIDSGQVQYTILDSTVEGSAFVNWDVREVSSIRHLVWSQSNPHSDTTYVVVDTTIIPILEETDGMHQLIANGIAWNFPIGGSTIPVYRYASSPGVDTSVTVFNYVYFRYSLVQTDSTGLVSWSQGSSTGGHTATTYSTSVQLEGTPVLEVTGRAAPPRTFVLMQNYPNPFNPSTTISF